MALATTVTKFNTEGNRKVAYGTWTGSAGDASGTYSAGGAIFAAEFHDNLSTGPSPNGPVHVQFSQSSGDVTVDNHAAVTAGTFKVVFS